MPHDNFNPIDSFANLKERIDSFFRSPSRRPKYHAQLSLELSEEINPEFDDVSPSRDIADFINLLSALVPDGNIYLFGGILRDIALMGRKGFSSDIDIVIDGDWEDCVIYLESKRARRNKFGGYRLDVCGWPVDVWNARETWAIKQGHVVYNGISALTDTTVLNWDAILMNWRTRSFIYREGYLNALRQRTLDIVLEENPNPVGMAVRVFRHLAMKDAKRISFRAAEYLASCTSNYSFKEIQEHELGSYGSSVIELRHYKWFEFFGAEMHADFHRRSDAASDKFKREGIPLAAKQEKWDFDISVPGVGFVNSPV